MLNSQFIFLCCMSMRFWIPVSNVCIDFWGGGKKLLVSSAKTGQLPVKGERITSKLPCCRRGLQLQEANAQHLVPTACVNSSVGAAQCALVRACDCERTCVCEAFPGVKVCVCRCISGYNFSNGH